MLKKEEIKKFIEADRSSVKKSKAREGLRYYEAEHDILNFKIYYYNSDGNLVEDTENANVKISHAYFTELVDQKVNYLLSSEGSYIKSDYQDLQIELDRYFNDDFKAELAKLLTYASATSYSFLYAYKDVNGQTRFTHAKGTHVIEVQAKDANDNKDHVIYYYNKSVNGNTITAVEDWDDELVYYYLIDEDGKVEKEKREQNPRPHVVYDFPEHSYDVLGYVPFFRFDNNDNGNSDLKPIKALIDDYDLMACGLSNNILDLSEGYFAIKGYQGSNLDEMLRNLRTKKGIGVDEDGSVELKTVEIPTSARKEKMNVNKEGIYKFGMGFDSSQVGDGNITNIVIKSRYALLDIKCNKCEIGLKQFLKAIIKIAIDEINQNSETGYSEQDVYIEFPRVIPSNEVDTANVEKTNAETTQIQVGIILNVAAHLPDDVTIKEICKILDIDYEEIKSQLPEPEKIEVNKAEEILEIEGADNGNEQSTD